MSENEIIQEIKRITQDMQQAIIEGDCEEEIICEEAIAQLENELLYIRQGKE